MYQTNSGYTTGSTYETPNNYSPQQSYYPTIDAHFDNTENYSVATFTESKAMPVYVPSSAKNTYLSGQKQEHVFITEDHLVQGREPSPDIDTFSTIRDDIETAFELITGTKLTGVSIQVLNDDSFRKKHVEITGKWDEGVQGFSINKNGKGAVDEVFVRKGPLDRTVLTIGHEIGHVMSKTLGNEHDEEAKAFAFSLAWMETIVKNNILGLKNHINPQPAKNGLHNIAFEFVADLVEKGQKAIEIFQEVALGTLSVAKQEVVLL